MASHCRGDGHKDGLNHDGSHYPALFCIFLEMMVVADVGTNSVVLKQCVDMI